MWSDRLGYCGHLGLHSAAVAENRHTLTVVVGLTYWSARLSSLCMATYPQRLCSLLCALSGSNSNQTGGASPLSVCGVVGMPHQHQCRLVPAAAVRRRRLTRQAAHVLRSCVSPLSPSPPVSHSVAVSSLLRRRFSVVRRPSASSTLAVRIAPCRFRRAPASLRFSSEQPCNSSGERCSAVSA